MSLIQVVTMRGKVKRAPRTSLPPLVELDLEENQSIISFEISEAPWMFYADERVTTDWLWEAIVETRL